MCKLVSPRKRVGRGIGSGRGGHSTRGVSGQKLRNRGRNVKGFMVGQTHIAKRYPKLGVRSVIRSRFKSVGVMDYCRFLSVNGRHPQLCEFSKGRSDRIKVYLNGYPDVKFSLSDTEIGFVFTAGVKKWSENSIVETADGR